jgi:hypothetical protein
MGGYVAIEDRCDEQFPEADLHAILSLACLRLISRLYQITSYLLPSLWLSTDVGCHDRYSSKGNFDGNNGRVSALSHRLWATHAEFTVGHSRGWSSAQAQVNCTMP